MIWEKILLGILLIIIGFGIGVISETNEETLLNNNYPILGSQVKENPITTIPVVAIGGPSDKLQEKNIKIYDNRVLIDLDNAVLARFTDTKSMEPVLNKDTNAIEIYPKSADEIFVGDIISFDSNLVDGVIIHRVVEKNIDEEGVYFRTKGDNLDYTDPEIIRFAQIQRIVIGIIY